MGGNLGHARYWSRHVALQIKADLLGTPFKVFSETPCVDLGDPSDHVNRGKFRVLEALRHVYKSLFT